MASVRRPIRGQAVHPDDFTEAGRAEMAKRRNRPISKMGSMFAGEPEDQLMKLIRQKYGL